MENTHGGKIILKFLFTAGPSVNSRTLVGTQQGHGVVDQPEIAHIIAFQTQKAADSAIKRFGSKRSHGIAEKLHAGFFLPPPPDHSQVGVIEFMWQKP